VIAVLLALLLRVALTEQSLILPTYVTFYPVVFLAAVMGGMWAGILATTWSALLTDYFLLAPVGQFTVHSTSDIVALAIFCVSGVSVSVVTELYRRNREKKAASTIEDAILDERRKAVEDGELEETVRTERLRFLEVLESLRAGDISTIAPAAGLLGLKPSAAGRESRLPGLDQKKFRAFLRRTITIPFLGALVLAGAALWAAYNLNASMQLVNRTDQVIAQSRRLLKLTVDMETGERGYLVTGNDAFLQPYQEASKVIDSEYQKLYLLVADNPSQQARLEALRSRIHHWQVYADQMIALRRSGGAYADLTINLAGKAEVDQIRDQIDGFQSVEVQLREERNSVARRDWRLVETICILFGLVMGSGLMVYTYRRMQIIAASFEKSGHALAESERRWATTLASIGDAVLATDNQGRVTYLNPAAAALTGWQPEEAKGQPIQNIFKTINQDTREPADDIVSRVLNEQRVVELANHTSLRAKDGREIPIADSAAPIFDSDGKITGVVLVFHDVTERRRAENELKATLHRFYTILSNLNSAVLLVTDKGQTEFANQAFCDAFGFEGSPADQMGVDAATMIERIKSRYLNPDQAARHIREIVDRGERVLNEEISLQNGRVSLRDFIPLAVDGETYGRLWVHTDITEREWAEKALNESRAKLETALASMTDAVFISDAEGRLVHFNDAFVTYHRFSSRAECSKSIADCPTYLEAFMADGEPAPPEMWAMPRALRGETVTNTEYTLRRKDTGETWTGGYSFAPILDKEGAIIGSVVTARDITERKRVEEERQISSDFLAMINQSQGTKDLLQRAANFFQERSGCEAVGIRLREGEDYPYIETRGFSTEFVQLESKLCARTASGYVMHDNAGKAVLECLCGSIIHGRAEPLKPFYTTRGSFWSNSITDLVASAKADDLPFTARHQCNRAGYESMALFPMYVGEERFGLVQLNDRRKRRFSEQSIALWERLAGYLATAVTKFQAEDALRSSRQQLQAIIDGAPDTVVFLKDIDGRFITVNSRFEELLGITRDNVRGKTDYDIMTRDRADYYRTHDQQVLTTGQPLKIEELALLADGKEHTLLANKFPLFDAGGKPYAVCAISVDITERKRMEEALQRSEAQFRNLANAIPQLCWMANADGWIFWYNDRWYEYTGTTAEQMEGWGWQSVHDQDALPQVMERWKFSIMNATPFDMIFPLRGADGVFRPFLTRVMPIKDDDGRVVRWFGTNTDISEQKQIEAELRKNEERLSLALNVAQLGEWERDLKTGVGTRSLRHAKIFGYTSVDTEWNFEIFLTHIPPENRAKVTEWYKSSLTGGSWELETQIRRLDGEVRWVWFRSHIRLDEEGQPSRAYGIVMDITERKRAEEELRKLNRALTALSNSNMAILQVTDEKTFLNEVCRIIIRDCGHAMVWIGVAEHDKDKTVRPVAYSGFDDGYLETLRVRWDESKYGSGPTGTAIRTGEPSICRYMQTDPLFAPWRADATRRGYASSLVIPLKNGDETWGAITIYSREPDSFSEAEVDLLKELARDVESGVQTLRLRAAQIQVEEALRESKEQLGLFIEHAPAALAMFDSKMRYLHASRRWKVDYGLGDRELAGLSHYEVFPEIPERWKDAHRRGLAGEVLSGDADRFERVDGTVQLVRWEIRPWHESEGKVGGIVIFSEEISERKKAEEALLRSEKEAFQRQQLQALAKRLQQVREEERKMVARDLHDQIGQILTAIKLDVSWVIRRLPKSKDDVNDRLARSIEYINDGVRSVRRICSGLRPGILDDLGLAPAIEWQAKEFSTRTGIACQVSVPPGELDMDGDRATAFFRIFQECLTNVARHSEARSVHASLSAQDGNLILTVEDDGKGFLDSEVTGSLGVLGMKERAQVCGGSVKVSSSPGKGTTVTVIAPARAANTERDIDANTGSR
jgi:PAS domain S-box-containing protein